MRIKLHYEIGESDKIVLLTAEKKNKECVLRLEVVYNNYLALQVLDCAFYLVITR